MSAQRELYRLHELTLEVESAADSSDEGQSATPLYRALAAAVPELSRHKARLAISAGLLSVDGATELDPQHALDHAVPARLDLRQGIPAKGAQRARRRQGAHPGGERPFHILYEDDQVVVIDKASGILAAPTDADSRGHVLELLRAHWRAQGARDRFIGVVHRIDQATSGCLVVARSNQVQRILQAQFARHAAGRSYRCLVAGNPARDADTLSGKIGRGHDGRRAVVGVERPGKEAITHFEVLRRFARGAELRCTLETGRTHQIRIHLASIGCPVLGDPVYGPQRQRRGRDRRRQRERGIELPPKAPRLMLHAERVAFDHPKSGTRIEVEAPVPEVFAEVARKLGPGGRAGG